MSGCLMGGLSVSYRAENMGRPITYQPPAWAAQLPPPEEFGRQPRAFASGQWWLEHPGWIDDLWDPEKARDELIRITYGYWDHIKNHCPHRKEAANWALEWVQFLPGKRESRRYIGPHVLSQKDVEAGGKFFDVVGYGGWSMDDHHPAGFESVKIGAPATMMHPAPSPYGIPYRTLYSSNVPNLMFAGRDASCTDTRIDLLLFGEEQVDNLGEDNTSSRGKGEGHCAQEQNIKRPDTQKVFGIHGSPHGYAQENRNDVDQGPTRCFAQTLGHTALSQQVPEHKQANEWCRGWNRQ